MFLSLVVAASAFVAIVLFSSWVLQGRKHPSDSRIRALALDRVGQSGLAAIPFEQRVVTPLIDSVGKWVASFLPSAYLRRAEHKLVLAGQPMTPTAFYALMFGLGALLAGSYVLLVVVASGGLPQIAALLPGAFLGVIGMYLVSFRLSSRARARQKAMIKALPDFMDLLTICVEAGLGLDAAFHRVAEKQSGPFVDEIRRMLREIGLGQARRDALVDLAERTDIEDVRTFVNAVIQAEQLGTSLAQVLRVQSERLRVRRRQRAEEAARKVAVKMVFPLVFCLMPCLFIFILGPIVVNLIGYFSSQ